MQLAEAFPVEQQNLHARSNVQLKTVMRIIYSFDDGTSKPKRFVLIGENENEICALIINSELNENVYPPGSEKHRLQVPIKSSIGSTYIKHDSYVDCSQIFPYTKEFLTNLFIRNPEYVIGSMIDTHWNAIRAAVRNAKTIPLKSKKKFYLI